MSSTLFSFGSCAINLALILPNNCRSILTSPSILVCPPGVGMSCGSLPNQQVCLMSDEVYSGMGHMIPVSYNRTGDNLTVVYDAGLVCNFGTKDKDRKSTIVYVCDLAAGYNSDPTFVRDDAGDPCSKVFQWRTAAACCSTIAPTRTPTVSGFTYTPTTPTTTPTASGILSFQVHISFNITV
jgi:hypothetical protein